MVWTAQLHNSLPEDLLNHLKTILNVFATITENTTISTFKFLKNDPNLI